MRHLSALLTLAAAAACAQSPRAVQTGAATTVTVTRTTTATRVASADGFRVPESVKYDAARDVWYVSNVNGNPGDHDNNGYISRLRADGAVRDTMFIAAGRGGVALDAPKGMALTGDTLWVADIDKVRAFDVTSGAALFTVDFGVLNAIFLNDIAVGPDRALYITDTGIRFTATGIEHPATDKIFVIPADNRRTARAVVESDAFSRPNGITYDARRARFIVVPFGGNSIYAWSGAPGQGPTPIANGPGQFDGVEVMSDGRILVSSWADSSVSVVNGNSLLKIIGNVPSPADIGLDARRSRVAIPLFTGGRVEIWEVSGR